MTCDRENFLNDTWNIYFHDPYDSNWTTQSYERLASVGTIEEFWQHFQSLKGNLHKGMFFIMREYVFPELTTANKCLQKLSAGNRTRVIARWQQWKGLK